MPTATGLNSKVRRPESTALPFAIRRYSSLSKIKDDQLDAYFIVAGYPTGSVEELASAAGCGLVPIEGPEVDALLRKYQCFVNDLIPRISLRAPNGSNYVVAEGGGGGDVRGDRGVLWRQYRPDLYEWPRHCSQKRSY